MADVPGQKLNFWEESNLMADVAGQKLNFWEESNLRRVDQNHQ